MVGVNCQLAIRRLTTAPDAALGAVLLVAAVVATLGADGEQPVARAALAGLTVSGIALRRRMPVLAAAWVSIGIALESALTESPDEMPVLLAVVIAAFSVATHAPLQQAFVGATLLSMSTALAIALDPSDSLGNILPTLALFILVPAAIGVTVHRGRRDVVSLKMRADALAREAEQAADMERRRIARELHDVVSHAVTLIAVQAEAGAAAGDNPPAARSAFESIADVSRDALSELHRLLGLLQAQESAGPEPGLDRLPALVDGVRAAGLAVDVQEAKGRDQLPAQVDHCAYRVVQEGLTNALRHAPSACVRVHVICDDLAVRVGVESRGKQHRSAYGGTGQGLAGLRERVLALGGTFEAGLTGDGSFRLDVRIPVAAA